MRSSLPVIVLKCNVRSDFSFDKEVILLDSDIVSPMHSSGNLCLIQYN